MEPDEQGRCCPNPHDDNKVLFTDAAPAGLRPELQSFLAGFDYGESRLRATAALEAQFARSYVSSKHWAERLAGR